MAVLEVAVAGDTVEIKNGGTLCPPVGRVVGWLQFETRSSDGRRVQRKPQLGPYRTAVMTLFCFQVPQWRSSG